MDQRTLASLVVALVVGLALAARIGWTRSTKKSQRDGHLFDALALLLAALGLGAAHLTLTGAVPLGSFEQQPLWVAAAGLAAGVLCVWLPKGRVALTLGALLVALTAAVFLPCARAEWPSAAAWPVALAGLTAGSGLVLVSTARLAPRVPGPLWPAQLAAAFAGLAVLSLLAHYAKFAIAGVAGFLLLLPAALWLLVRRRARFGAAPSTVVVATLLALAFGAYFHTFDRPPLWCFTLLGAAPAGGWVAETLPRRSGARYWLLHAAGFLVPILIAVGYALATSDLSGNDEYDYEY